MSQSAPDVPDINEPSAEQIEALCHALVSDDPRAGAQMILTAQEGGASPEAVYLHYLAAAARCLGQWWEDDVLGFAQVTLGSSRIYAIMRAMSHLFVSGSVSEQRSALFAAVPGEEHTLGISMAADLFRKSGWDIDLHLGLDHDALVQVVEAAPHDLVGLSASGLHSAAATARLVVALRISAPKTRLVLSGHIIDEAADLVAAMDVDVIEGDAEEARLMIERLWDRMHPGA